MQTCKNYSNIMYYEYKYDNLGTILNVIVMYIIGDFYLIINSLINERIMVHSTFRLK